MEQEQHSQPEHKEKGRAPFATVKFLVFALIGIVSFFGLSQAYQYYNCHLAVSADIAAERQDALNNTSQNYNKTFDTGRQANIACAFEAGTNPLSGNEGSIATNYFIGTLVIDGIIFGAYKFATKKQTA